MRSIRFGRLCGPFERIQRLFQLQNFTRRLQRQSLEFFGPQPLVRIAGRGQFLFDQKLNLRRRGCRFGVSDWLANIRSRQSFRLILAPHRIGEKLTIRPLLLSSTGHGWPFGFGHHRQRPKQCPRRTHFSPRAIRRLARLQVSVVRRGRGSRIPAAHHETDQASHKNDDRLKNHSRGGHVRFPQAQAASAAERYRRQRRHDKIGLTGITPKPTAYSPSPGRALICFRRDLCFFCLSRRSFDARVGRVGRRLRGGVDTWRIISASFSRQSDRLASRSRVR